jgi:integrase
VKPSAFERAARAHIASRGSPGTRKLYTADLDAWLEHCRVREHDPNEPTLEAATEFRDALVNKYEGSTVRRVLSALSSMYDSAGLTNHFKSKHRLDRPPADEVSVTPAYSEEEAQELVDHALAAVREDKTLRSLRTAVIVRLLYDTGLRASEVAKMQRSGLTRIEDGYQLFDRVKKKGRVETFLPETSAMLLDEWLKRAPSDSKWVFAAARGSGHINTSTIREFVAELGRVVGVEKRARPHRFRATFITEALNKLPLNEVQASVHHSDPSTTQRYDRGKRGAGVTAAVAKARQGRK